MIIQVPKTILVSISTCDDCGRECGSHCDGCNKSLCWPCIAQTEVEVDGDYRTRYCKACWEIIQGYKPLIAQLHDQIDLLEAECETKCKEKRKVDSEKGSIL